MKHAMLFFCSLFLATIGLSCSQQEKTQEAEKRITIWWAQWAPADGLQELGNLFEKETGIAVRVHQIPWSSYQDQVFLNFGNRQTDFDIVIGDSQWIGRGATRGLYIDLTEWLPSAVDMGKIHPRAARYLCEYPPGSGKFYAAPCETDAVGFVYRKDWFEDPKEKADFQTKYGRELTPPDTWSEFRDTAEFFYRPQEKKYGCALLTGRGYDSLTMGFQMFLWGYGGSWGNPTSFETQNHINKPEVAAGLNFFRDLLNFAPNGAANFDYSKTFESFINGTTAMSMNYFAFYPGIVDQMGDRAGFFMIPRVKDQPRFVSLGGQGFSISAKVPEAKQELAKKFIAWFLQTEIQREWITKDAGFTANTDILNSEAFRTASPYNRAFAESLDFLQDFWNVPVYNELLAVSQRYLGEALDGVRPAQEALDLIAAEHAQIFEDAGLRK